MVGESPGIRRRDAADEAFVPSRRAPAGCRPGGAAARLAAVDQLDGADHHRVGAATDGARGRGIADAEAHADRRFTC